MCRLVNKHSYNQNMLICMPSRRFMILLAPYPERSRRCDGPVARDYIQPQGITFTDENNAQSPCNSHFPFWPAVFFAFSCSIITEYLSPVSTLFSETIHN
jgi:hypothetical protein